MRSVRAPRRSRGYGRQDRSRHRFPPRTFYSCADRASRFANETSRSCQRLVAFGSRCDRTASTIRLRGSEAIMNDEAVQKQSDDPRVQLAFERTFLAYERTRIVWVRTA